MVVNQAGFVDFEVTWRKDVFAGAPQASSAANFGAVGINFRARKALSEDEWYAVNCELPNLTTIQIGTLPAPAGEHSIGP